MTQQEMETIITELETTFKQPVNEKPWTAKGFCFCRNVHTKPNDQTQRYETYYGVSLWFNNEIVTTVSTVNKWEAFKSVVRLFRQVETIGTYTGECLECGRTSIISDGSRLCQGCTIYLTTDSQ